MNAARVTRIALVVAVVSFAGWLSWRAHPSIFAAPRSDFAMLHAAAQAWLQGTDPYTAVGPGKSYNVAHGLFYPFTAILFSVLPSSTPWPDLVFVVMGAALFAWGVTSHPRYRPAWFVFLTPAFLYAARMSQWSMLIAGAALAPWCGFLLACKPTTGTALFLAYPSRRTAIGAAVFGAVSVALLPVWPWEWFAETRMNTAHIRAPITYWGGPLLLLALLKWRRAEARLLAALACIPHTPELYESLTLFLIPRTLPEGAILAALNYGVVVARVTAGPRPDYVGDMLLTGQWMVWLLYLPCLAMVLTRPNRADDSDARPQSEPANATPVL